MFSWKICLTKRCWITKERLSQMLQKIEESIAVLGGFSPTLITFMVSHMQTLLLLTPLYFLATANKRNTKKKKSPLPTIPLFPCSPVVCKPCHSYYCSPLLVCWGRTRSHLLIENTWIDKTYLENFIGLPNMKEKIPPPRNRVKHSTLIIQPNIPVRKYFLCFKPECCSLKKGIIIKRFRL